MVKRIYLEAKFVLPSTPSEGAHLFLTMRDDADGRDMESVEYPSAKEDVPPLQRSCKEAALCIKRTNLLSDFD